jgi:hypothetical protein
MMRPCIECLALNQSEFSSHSSAQFAHMGLHAHCSVRTVWVAYFGGRHNEDCAGAMCESLADCLFWALCFPLGMYDWSRRSRCVMLLNGLWEGVPCWLCLFGSCVFTQGL